MKLSNGVFSDFTLYQVLKSGIIKCDKFSGASTNSSQGNQTSNGCIGLKTICGDYIIKYEIAEYSYLSNSERSLKGKLIIMKDMAVVDEKDDVVFTFSLS